jgi:hypothetical protein
MRTLLNIFAGLAGGVLAIAIGAVFVLLLVMQAVFVPVAQIALSPVFFAYHVAQGMSEPATASAPSAVPPTPHLNQAHVPIAVFTFLRSLQPHLDQALEGGGAADEAAVHPAFSDAAWQDLHTLLDTQLVPDMIFTDSLDKPEANDTNNCAPVAGHKCWGIEYRIFGQSPDGSTDDRLVQMSVVATGPSVYQIVSIFSSDGPRP